MPTPTNQYYQRAFGALAGTLARARQMVNEFVLIQRGFDLIGTFTGATKYQLSCSDLSSDLEITPEAAYFDVQRALTLVECRATVLQPSASGAITISATVDGVPLFTVPITIDEGEDSSLTAAVQSELAITSIPDGSRIVISIDAPGAGAKGLIFSALGTITNLMPAP
jgi:hypothetical protein